MNTSFLGRLEPSLQIYDSVFAQVMARDYNLVPLCEKRVMAHREALEATLEAATDYKLKYEKLKDFVRGKWKGDCPECAALANEVFNKEQAND